MGSKTKIIRGVVVTLAAGLLCTGVKSEAEVDDIGEKSRQGRLFPIFQVVRFANDVCQAGSRNGTCFTEAECSGRGGVSDGSCASGYGVCCVFTLNCGEMSSENCTYFESNAVMSGGCRATVCPCGNSICQLRLDFEMFVITGPVVASDSVAKATGGAVLGAGPMVSLVTQCLTDTFQVVGSGGASNSDVLCGTNTNQHLYVEADPGCNDLVFQLGRVGFGGMAVTNRQWLIKVTQFDCSFPNLAPVGCTQYFFGAAADSVRTFNYQGGAGVHLANQDQTICVRREATNCRICWFAANRMDFDVSGQNTNAATPNGMGFNKGTMCCSYGTNGLLTQGYDCVNIPGAEKAADTKARVGSNICGRSNGLVTSGGRSIAGDADNSATVCSRRQPFYIRFRSDSFEFAEPDAAMAESANVNSGFMLQFFMDAINC